jgi:triacylglycerol lipase
MGNEIISPEVAGQSVLFARLAAGAYLDISVRTLTGLKPLENEQRFSDDATDTQGVMGRWKNDVVIAFRGTEAKLSDWLATNASVGLVGNPRGAGKLHTGFLRAAKSVYPQITQFIRNVKDENSRIFLCGHSLGGALATIVAAWLKNDAAALHPRAVFTYGSPRVGDADYVRQWSQLGLSKCTYAWVAAGDPVPRVAPYLFGYRHVTKLQYQLDQGTLGTTNLDRKAEIQLEDEWLDGIPAAKQLAWFASRVDDAMTNASTKAHSITGSYLKQIQKVKKELS